MPKQRTARQRHPNETTRMRVRNMSIALLELDDIASAIGVSAENLQKHYKNEILNSRSIAAEQLVGMLMSKALEEGDTACAKFLLQRQPAWRAYVKEQTKVSLRDAGLKGLSEAHKNEDFQPLKPRIVE